MGTCQAERLEQAPATATKSGWVYGRGAWLVADRSAGVAVVVPDDTPGPRRETMAELVLPPVHRGGSPGDEQDRGISTITERLDAQVHPVRLHDPLVGVRRRCPGPGAPGCAGVSVLSLFVISGRVS